MVGAAVDVRGTGGSEGSLDQNFFSPREARDSAAVIEYLGTQPYSTGKVGMAGGSYVGITQYLAAGHDPPHLAAIVPMVAISDLYRDGFAHGGIPNLSFDLQYIGVQGAPGAVGPNTDPALLEATLGAKLGQAPVGTIAFDYLERPNDDPFYTDRSPIALAHNITVPALIIGGWNDGLLRGAPEMYKALSRRDGVETRLYIDPCAHKGCGAPFAPLTDPPGRHDPAGLTFEFLAKHLLGAQTPARPPVELYLQGANRYVQSESWPPAGVEYEQLALGDGTLGDANRGTESVTYTSNPAAGFSLAFNRFGTVAATPFLPTDQRLEDSQGVTFRTDPMRDATAIAGPIKLHLVASSSATDTDWYAKVMDVGPDGSQRLITDGALRASHRALDAQRSTDARPYHPHTDPTPIEPGRFYDYEIEIWPTAYELAPDHRLQLRVTSSDLPTHLPGSFAFDRDNPTAARVDLQSPATNTIRLDGSYLQLPIARDLAGACTKATPPQRLRLRRHHSTRVRATVRRAGARVAGAQVTLRARGLRRTAQTGARGRVTFKVGANHGRRATVRTDACGARIAARRR